MKNKDIEDTDTPQEALLYTSDNPNVKELRVAYERTVSDLTVFSNDCRDSYDQRRNIWPGKSKDMRKHGSEAFPWDGAADTEAHIINDRINSYVALFMSSLQRANIRAYPVEASDAGRSAVVSSFLKWMSTTYIPQFRRQMELGANYLLERGIMVTYVGWEREDRTFKQKLSLDQLAQLSPDLVRIILEGADDANLIEMLKQQFKGLKDKTAKKILKDLRKDGVAEFPIVKRSVDRPKVCALGADADFLFPAYTTDPQQAPYCFWRVPMTAQELRNKISTDGWDEEWVDYVIEHCKTGSVVKREQSVGTRTSVSESENEGELFEIVYGYRRLIDPEDNAEGIYCTIFHKDVVGKTEVPDHAKHELMNGYEDYPVVVTKLSEDNKRLYDVQSFPQLLKGLQNQVKVERDSRIDRNSMATLPPVMHPVGNAPSSWAPGAFVSYRRQGEFQFGPTPTYNPGSVEMETIQIAQADSLVGLTLESPLSQVKQQNYVNKFLYHVRDVLRLAFKCYQRFGPDEVFFRVTGVPDPQKFSKGNPDEDFDINIDFNILHNDPESLEQQLQAMVSLTQLDKNGVMDINSLIGIAAASINPIMADAVLRPVEQAQQQVVKQVTDDLSKIYAGIEVGARPNGYQVAMQTIQQYVQQPDVMQRLQSDESFKSRLEKYMKQYSFQAQQAQNAQIGKIGTAPASMGAVPTQTLTSN